jgi:transcriptional regulator with XRE-family HTH domain
MTKRKTKKEDEEREYQRLVAEETLIFEATELLSELIEAEEINRKELATRLGRSKGFVTQILSGERNMTLRTLADFAFALEHRVKVEASPLSASADGGEAASQSGPTMARVYGGVGEFLAQPTCAGRAHGAPRRPEAAEGAVLSPGINWMRAHARAGGESPDMSRLGTLEPLCEGGPKEHIAG